MLDLAGIAFGNGVLDVVADFGEQTFVAARRVSAKGWVLATDIAARMHPQGSRADLNYWRLAVSGGFCRLSFASSGVVDERTSASSTLPRVAEADRVADFKEVAVFLRRLRTRPGERHVQRKQRVKVNLSGLRRLP